MRLSLCVAAAFTLIFTVSLTSQDAGPFDVLIKNGQVIDGSGNPWRLADIGVRGGRIAALGRLDGQTAAKVIDAGGLTVTPGFIDVHSHASAGLAGALKEGRQLLAQGLTTVTLNPDGGGPIDIKQPARRVRTRRHRRQRRVVCAARIDSPRGARHGRSRAVAAELDRMIGLVRAGMSAGAIGLSSGIYYAPGSYAKTDEVIAMAKAAGEAGGVYESHIRDEADYNIGVVAAVDEVIRVSEEAHIPGIVAHMKALGPSSWGLSRRWSNTSRRLAIAALKSGRINILTTRAERASSAR